MPKKKLSQKEIAFCRYYSYLQNPAQAARLAGYCYNNALQSGLELLADRTIYAKVQELCGGTLGQVKAGLGRLAFGEVSDAVRLLLAGEECDTNNLENLDLLNVSEIKRVKGGGFEVKFFDRMDALDRLAAIEKQESSQKDNSFMEALARSAAALKEDDDNEQV